MLRTPALIGALALGPVAILAPAAAPASTAITCAGLTATIVGTAG